MIIRLSVVDVVTFESYFGHSQIVKIGKNTSLDCHRTQTIRPIPTPTATPFRSGSKAGHILFPVAEVALIGIL